MKLTDVLPEKQMSSNLEGENKFQVIEELLDLLDNNKKIINKEQALQDVLAREGYLSTGLENGLAIPHAKTDGVEQLVISLGIKKAGIEFESLDGKAAHLIFLVLSPRDTSGPHIQALATISRNLKEKTLRDALIRAESAAEMTEILTSFES